MSLKVNITVSTSPYHICSGVRDQAPGEVNLAEIVIWIIFSRSKKIELETEASL